MNEFLKNLFKEYGIDIAENIEEFVEKFDPTKHVSFFDISRRDIERGHIQTYVDSFKRISKQASKFRTSMFIGISGYDADARELYQIPEVRSWVQRFYKNVPHLFYFLEPSYSMLVIFLCLVDIKESMSADGKYMNVNIEKQKAKPLVEKIVRNTVNFSRQIGDPIEVQFAIANLILQQLGYDHL